MTVISQKSDGPDIQNIRALIKSNPGIVLDDLEVMRELAVRAEGSLGENVVDLRGAALKILDKRRDDLEEANRLLVAASHENLLSVQRIQNAVLRLLEADSLEEFRMALEDAAAKTLRIDRIRVLLEGRFDRLGTRTAHGTTIIACKRGFVQRYYALPEAFETGRILLRPTTPLSFEAYGKSGPPLRSEALLPLSFRNPNNIGLLLMGSRNAHQFEAGMGTDLLEFFRAAAERVTWRWLA